jgi:ABC-2 type transport system ATP-binding protein
MSEPRCSLVDIVKEYPAPGGRIRALDGLSIEIRAGEILCLLGPNGAGKSTLVDVASSLLKPDSGTVIRRGVLGLCEQPTMVWDAFTPREQLLFMASIRRIKSVAARARALELAERLGFSDCLDRRASALSGGSRRKLHIALSLVHSPDLLIMDEPESGLDSASRIALRAFLRSLADAGAAILVATHNIFEAEKAADRLAIIDRGMLLASGSPAELKDRAAAAGLADIEDLYFSLTEGKVSA